MSKIRKLFESEMIASGYEPWELEIDQETGEYVGEELPAMWVGWRAGWYARHATMTVELPANCCGHAITVDELRSMLEKSGIALETGK
ncbi:MAG: hypothetical protein ACRCXB_19245 [Aeromonadaceae bacterium]